MDFMGSNKSRKSKIDQALEDAQNPKPKKPKPKPKATGNKHATAPKIR